MSLNVPVTSLGWRLLPVVVAACAALVAASFVIALTTSGNEASLADPPRVPAVVEAEAPAWTMRVFPVGAKDGLTRPQRARFEAQREELTKIVRRVFDAWLFGRAPAVTINRHFAAAAAGEATRLDLLIDDPSAAVIARRARIGIEGGVPRNAAAEIVIRGSNWIDRATLWMHRGADGWKVIAFEVDRKARG